MTKEFKSTAKAVDKNLTIPGRTGHDHGYRKTVESLPDYLKSNVNKKFLDGTLDQLVSNGSTVRANSYYGSKKGLVNNGVDLYYDANSTLKNQYQFDPAVTSDYKGIDEPKLHITYDDILNNMRRDVEEMDATSFDYNRFFQGENFTWRPPISENKFLNYNLYYWFEAGLPTIEIDGSFNPTTEIIGKAFYNYTSGTKNISFQNGMKIKFGSTISGAHPTFANKHYIVEGVGTEIFLIDLSITPWMGEYTFVASIDETERAYWDIIGGAVAPATYIDFSINEHVANRKEYIVIQRGTRDKSIWSRINQWYHIDTINDVLTFLGKEIDVTILEKRKAIRPIIEFERNIQLYTHGDFGRAPITYKCDTAQLPATLIGAASLVLDTTFTFINGDTILFTNSADVTYKNKIFTVGGVGAGITLTLVTDSRDGTGAPSIGETVINPGRTPFTPPAIGQGREYYYNGTTWTITQQKTKDNQAPLFELWDDQQRKLSDINLFEKTTFAGNKIFSYVEGTRTDKELGFNTKYGVADTDNLLNKNYQNLVFNWDQGTERYVYGDLPSQEKMIGYYYLYNYGFDEYDNGWKKGSVRLPVTRTIKVDANMATNQLVEVDLVDVYGISNDIHFLVTFDDGKFTWYEKEANKALTKIYPMHGDIADIFVVQRRKYTIEFHHPTESLIIETEAVGGGTTIVTTLTDGTFTLDQGLIGPLSLGASIYRNSTSSAKGTIYCSREGEQADHHPRVYYNGQATIHGLDWNLVESDADPDIDTVVQIALADCPCEDPVEGRQIIRELKENDVIDIEWYTSKDSKERYDVTHQLQSNPLNAEPAEISFHEVFDHFAEILLNHRGYSGELSHPGIDSKSHQLIKQNVQGTIQQQNFPFVLNSLLYTDNNYNITNSIRYVADEWERYRNKFIKTAKNKVNTSVTGTLIRDIIDSTLAQLNVGKNVNFIFAHSHMAYYNSYEDSTYTADGILVDFDLGIEIDITDEYTNHVYVYVDNVLQIKNEDYTLANKTVTFVTAPAATKTVLVRVINNIPTVAPSYVPTSLQKNGLWQIFKPELTGSHILGHDGVEIPLTGIGDADSAIFEFENRIYNNIASKHDVIHYDYYNIMPGAERATWATRTQWNAIQEDRFNSWAHENNVSISNTAFKNTDYTLGDPLTHNYSSLGIPGHIRGVFNWFYDTQDPVATPWEMLGYGQKPSFWDTQYDWRNTANGGNDAKRAALISALKFGMTGATGSLIHKVQLSRPGFITPVGVDGVLLNPVTTGLVTAPSAPDALADFKFGDLSDVELQWRNDDKFQWAVLETLYKFRSNDLSHLKWNHTDTETINSELLDNVTRKRVRPEDMEVHLESIAGADPDDCRFTTVDKVLIQRSGINNLLIENVHNVNVTEPVDFIKYVEALNVRLAFKVEGYTDKNSTRLAVDTLGVTNEKFIPEEDFHVHFYRSAPLKQVSISGVRVIFNGTAFEVHGGDTILSSFLVTESNKGGPFDVVEVSNTSPTVTVSKYKNTTGNILKIPYGAEYTKVGDVYDFLINLGRYYESIGVMYKSYDTEGYHNWNRAASDFVSWHAAFTSPLVAGDEVYLSPHNKELIFRDADKRFIDHAVSKVNEVFNIADKNGNRINSKYIDVNRLDNISQGDTPAAREYEFVITAIEENTELFFVRLNVIEYDHVITVNRYTVFADIVYDTLLNSRIWRAKFIGQKTGDWTGLPKGAGYVVTDTKLIPNFEKTISDIDRGYFSTEETVLNQALVDASRATLGYNTKAYLKDLLYNKDAAFEFWKGLIHKAGTPSVNTNIGRSTDINNILTDVEVNEEWMFKLADAGATEKNLVYEFQLKTDEVDHDPQIIEFPLDVSADGITQNEVPYDEKITMSPSDPRWVHKPTDRIEFSTLTTDEYNATNIYWPGMPLITETTNQTLYEKDLPTLYDSSKFELDSYNKFNDYMVGDIVRHEGKIFTAQTDIKGSVSNGAFSGIPLPVLQWTETAEPYRPVYWIAKKTVVSNIDSHFSGGRPMVYKAFDTNISIAQIGKGIATTDKAEVTTVAAHNLTVSDYCIIVGTTTRPVMDGIFKVDSLAVDSAGTLEDESTTVFYIDSYTDTNTLFGKVLPLMPIMFDTITELNATIADSRYAWKAGDIGYTMDTAYKFNGVSFAIERRSWIGNHGIDKVNPRSLNNVNKVYNPKTKQQLAKFETYDPIKGVIPGIAEREIDTVGTLDTAVYTYSTDRSGNIDDRDFWERNEVGTTWWDTSTAVFIDYEQGTNSYKRNNWGKLFPGASIDVYEWVESPVEPGDWESKTGTTLNGISITGTPFSIVNEEEEIVYRYSIKQKYNSNTLQLETYYYFWVKGKTDVPNIISRNLSVKSVASYIENPSNLGLSWIAPIEKHAMIISNFGDTFEDKDAIFQIRFGEEQDVHSEFMLITEGDDTETIPEFFHGRMRDSLTTIAKTKETLSFTAWTAGIAYSTGSVVVNASIYYKAITPIAAAATFDATKWSRLYDITDVNTTASTLTEYRYGNVPDLSLHKLNQIGNRVRPAQSWYEDLTTARRIFIEKTNMLLKEMNLIDSSIDWDKTIGTTITRGAISYNLADYWKYINWESATYSSTTIPIKVIALRKNLSDEDLLLSVNIGDTVKVLEDGSGRWEIYQYVAEVPCTIAESWKLIAKERGTIELSCKLWDGYLDCGGWDICTWAGAIEWDKFPECELFEIINAIKNDIFIGDFKYAYGRLFFTMIDQALVDQPQLDWVHKTTYVQLKIDTNLAVKVNLYKPEVSDYIVDYIKDVKPYHTKLRDVFNIKSHLETACITVTDTDTKKIIVKFDRVGCGWDSNVQNPWDVHHDGNPQWDRGRSSMCDDWCKDLVDGGNCPEILTPGWDNNCRGWDTIAYDTTEVSVLEDLFLDTIYNASTFGLDPATIELIIEGNKFIQPNQTCYPEELVPVIPYDAVDIRVQTNLSGSTITNDTRTFHMFKDALDYFHLHRVNNNGGKTHIISALGQLDTEIEIVAGHGATDLTQPDPELNVPGSVWIGTERIEFWQIDPSAGGAGGDLLKGAVRGTLGTSAMAHAINSQVVDNGRRQQIPGIPDYWDYMDSLGTTPATLHVHTAFNDLGVTLQASTNVEAEFINNGNDGTIWPNT